MLQTILIGPPRGERKGGIAQFIQFVLHYKPLGLRLLLAAAVWGLGWLAWPFLADLGFFAFEIYASLILIRFLADVSQHGELGRTLAAMWLPIAVTAVATYLLFVNDQGRELGLGIMDSAAKAPFLFLVLIYWGLNNWLSARVGLAREFPQPEKEQVLLFWGPRLVGVTAHLLVAFSLSAAAFSQSDLQTKEPWLVFAAPLAILLATGFAWFLDHGHLSQRSNAALRAHARKRMRQVGGVTVVDTTDSPATGTNVASEAPHFSHLAMCEKSVNPPLGWVLSERTRLRFKDILKDCGNENELAALKKALGLPASVSAGATNDAKNMPR
jgi:hypothetical protein